MEPLSALPPCAARAVVVKRASGIALLFAVCAVALAVSVAKAGQPRLPEPEPGSPEAWSHWRSPKFSISPFDSQLPRKEAPLTLLEARSEWVYLFPPLPTHEMGRLTVQRFSTPAAERLGFGSAGADERPEWERLRRQFAAALPDTAELIQANEFGLVVRCLGRRELVGGFAIPSLMQDAATAARVRAGLASDPRTRDLPRNVTCEAGCVRLNGPFPNVAMLTLAVNATIGVDGVREVRADLPDDMLVLLGLTR